jgi:hypothetical protein
MAAPKTLTDLLKAQPEDELQALVESLRVEIGRLQAELGFVENALASRSRKRPSRTTADGSSRRSGIKRSDLVPIVQEFGRPVLPSDVTAVLHRRGVEITAAAVRTNMSRLVEDGSLVRDEQGRYWVAHAKNGSGQPLFRVPEFRPGS